MNATSSDPAGNVSHQLLVAGDAETQRRPGRGGDLLDRSVRSSDQERRVTGVRHPQGLVERLDDRVGRGGELRRQRWAAAALLDPDQVGDLRVQDGEDVRRRQVGVRGRAHAGPCLPHQDRGGDAAARDVTHADADPSRTEVVDVPPVAADVDVLAAREIAGGDLQPRQRWRGRRKQGLLEVEGGALLLLVRAQVGDRRTGPHRQRLQELTVGLGVGRAGPCRQQHQRSGETTSDDQRDRGDVVRRRAGHPLAGGRVRGGVRVRRVSQRDEDDLPRRQRLLPGRGTAAG